MSTAEVTRFTVVIMIHLEAPATAAEVTAGVTAEITTEATADMAAVAADGASIAVAEGEEDIAVVEAAGETTAAAEAEAEEIAGEAEAEETAGEEVGEQHGPFMIVELHCIHTNRWQIHPATFNSQPHGYLTAVKRMGPKHESASRVELAGVIEKTVHVAGATQTNSTMIGDSKIHARVG